MKTSDHRIRFLCMQLFTFYLFFQFPVGSTSAWAQAEGGAERAGSQIEGYGYDGGNNIEVGGGGGSNSSNGDVNANSMSGFSFDLANSTAGQMAMAAAVGQMDPGTAMAMGLTSGMLDANVSGQPNPFSGVLPGSTLLIAAQTLIAVAVNLKGQMAVGLVSSDYKTRQGQVQALTSSLGPGPVSVTLRTQ